jgi:hypothetical protein
MGWVFDPENPQHWELADEIASAREHEEHAAALHDELFAYWLEPVDLQSDVATKMSVAGRRPAVRHAPPCAAHCSVMPRGRLSVSQIRRQQ